jgi:hypothetical protein
MANAIVEGRQGVDVVEASDEEPVDTHVDYKIDDVLTDD